MNPNAAAYRLLADATLVIHAGFVLFYSAPEWVLTLIYSVIAVIVAATLIVYPPQRRRKLTRDRGL